MKHRRTATIVLGLALLALVAGEVRAEPAFAVRTGYRCSQCHVNRSGGGMRTSFGSIYGQVTLPARLLTWGDSGNILGANPNARFAVGADLRVRYLQVDVDQGEDVSTFEVEEANLYLEARLVPGRFSLYLDEQVGPGGASAREVFALVGFMPKHNGYVKMGKILPPFGWRLPDDDSFIRQFTGFTYSNPDTGIEFGIEPGLWSFHLAAVNGSQGSTDGNRTKKFSTTVARRFGRKGRIGLSGSNDIDSGTTTQAGIFGGINFGRLTLLAEGDWGQQRPDDDSGTQTQWLAYFEANYLVSRGLNIKYVHDWRDPDRDTPTDQQTRDSIGVEYIPWPFVQLRAFARFKDGPPQVIGARDNQYEIEAHFWF